MDGFTEDCQSDMHTQVCLLCPSLCFYQLAWEAQPAQQWGLPAGSHPALPCPAPGLTSAALPQPLCPRTKQLVKGNAIPLPLAPMLCSSLASTLFSEVKNPLLLPETKACPRPVLLCSHFTSLTLLVSEDASLAFWSCSSCSWDVSDTSADYSSNRALWASIYCVCQGWFITWYYLIRTTWYIFNPLRKNKYNRLGREELKAISGNLAITSILISFQGLDRAAFDTKHSSLSKSTV